MIEAVMCSMYRIRANAQAERLMNSVLRGGLWLSSLVLVVYHHATPVVGQEPRFSLSNTDYSNHALVDISAIGVDDSSLHCISDDPQCCSAGAVDKFRGEFYFPGGVVVPISTMIRDGYFRNRLNDRIRLNRQPSGMTEGLFRCEIQTNAGVENLYIGVYDDDSGSPTVTGLVFDGTRNELTCTSTGGPATTVTWRENCGAALTSGYTQTQVVTDTSTATYTNTLSGGGIANGAYSCTVENTRGRSIMVMIVGTPPITVIVSGGTPTFGQSYSLTCSYTGGGGGSASVQWMGSDGSVITTGEGITVSSSPQYTLTFNQLQESHATDYFCQVTVGSDVGCGMGTIPAPTFTVSVDGGTATAGTQHSLSCSVSGVDLAVSGTTVMYTWFRGDSMLSSTSNQYAISSVLVTDAGDDYRCQVIITAPYLNGELTMSGRGSLRVMIPNPTIRFTGLPQTGVYSGLDVTLRCTVSSEILTGISADIILTGPTGPLTTTVDGRITVANVVEIFQGELFSRTYQFRPISGVDSGSYNCTGIVTPATDNDLVINGVGMGLEAIPVAAPTLDVSVPDLTTRVLDISPYNTFSLTCIATSLVGTAQTPLTKTIQWFLSIDSDPQEMITDSTSGVGVSPNNLEVAVSSSELIMTVDTAGDHNFVCRATLDLSPATDNIQSSAGRTVNVVGQSRPTTPTGLTIDNVQQDMATIRWTVESISYNPETYVVQYGTSESNLNMNSATVGSGDDINRVRFQLDMTITGLVLNTRYYYRVVATNRGGSTMSEVANFMSSTPPPDPPTALNPSKTGPTSYSFTWRRPDETFGDLTEYRLTCTPQLDGIPLPDSERTLATQLSIAISQLEHGVNYSCSLEAANGQGFSDPSAPVIITTDEAAPSGPPQSFTITAGFPGRDNVNFSWSLPAPADRNGVITSYLLRCESGGATPVTMMFDRAGTFTLGGFEAVTEYQCSITAINSVDSGPPAVGSVTTFEDYPGLVTDCESRWTRILNNNVIVTWSPPSNPNGIITGYLIQLSTVTSEEVLYDITVNTSTLSYEFGISELSLVAGVPYNVTIAAVNSFASGEVCAFADFVDQVAPPANILNTLTISRSDDRTVIFLLWDPLPLDVVMGHVILTITYSQSGGARRRRQTSTTTECSSSPCMVPYEQGRVRITGVDHRLDYDISIQPENEDGEEGIAVSETSLGAQARPNSLTGLQSIGVSHSGVTILWTVESISYNPETYVVQYGTSESSLNMNSATVESGDDINRVDFQLEATITGLEPNTQYYYQVVATNRAGSTTSSTTTFTTEMDSMLFQMRLTGFVSCLEWVDINSVAKIEDIVNVITGSVNQRCACGFNVSQITNGVLRCFTESPQAVTFRATLNGRAGVYSSDVVTHISEWTATSDLTIPVQSVLRSVDGSCAVAIISYDDGECESRTTEGISSDSVPVAAIIGGIVAVVLIIALAIVVIVVSLLVPRSKKSMKKDTSRNKRDPLPAVVLSNVTPQTAGDYDTVEMGHEYEAIDKYSDAYAEVKPPENQQTTGDYEFTQCAAYGTSTAQAKSTPAATSD